MSAVLGGLLFLYFGRGILGAVLWGISIVAGITAGIFWAEWVRKKTGIVEFHSKLIATSDLDKSQEKQRE